MTDRAESECSPTPRTICLGMFPESPEFPGLSFAAGLENPGEVLRSGTNEALEKFRVIVPLHILYSSKGTLSTLLALTYPLLCIVGVPSFTLDRPVSGQFLVWINCSWNLFATPHCLFTVQSMDSRYT